MSSWTKEQLERQPGVQRVKEQESKPQAPAGQPYRFPEGKREQPEAQEQRDFFNRVRSLEVLYPELQMVRSDNAGMRTDKRTAAMAQAAGLRAGYPDIDVPLARKGHYGLHIEMKAGKNKPTQQQRWWLDRLVEEGRYCCVCYSAQEAWDVLCWYLDIRASK